MCSEARHHLLTSKVHVSTLHAQVLRMASPVCEGSGVTFGAVHTNYAFDGKTWPFNRKSPPPDVIVCTPSFAAKYGSKHLELYDALEMMVLDEADMLLDGGFEKNMNEVMLARKRVMRLRQRATPPIEERSQVVLVGATIPNYGLKSVEAFVAKHFPDAVRVENELLHQTQPHITHDWMHVNPQTPFEDKVSLLLEVLHHADERERIMVFSNTARTTKALSEELQHAGVNAKPYHKDVHPEHRQMNLLQFALGEVNVLVCTDLAARGIDIAGVDHVIQFEFPENVVRVRA